MTRASAERERPRERDEGDDQRRAAGRSPNVAQAGGGVRDLRTGGRAVSAGSRARSVPPTASAVTARSTAPGSRHDPVARDRVERRAFAVGAVVWLYFARAIEDRED